jgi:hypothetical protein
MSLHIYSTGTLIVNTTQAQNYITSWAVPVGALELNSVYSKQNAASVWKKGMWFTSEFMIKLVIRFDYGWN